MRLIAKTSNETSKEDVMTEAAVVEKLQEEGVLQKPEEMDEYGRTESERTIELESGDAEAINNEVNDGKHQTYSSALHYVITRGLAEIKRQREAARSLAEKTILKAKRDNWSKLLQSNPKLIENNDLLQAMLKELGIKK
jgi:Arc/MetJ-type ribon-helix-helix transcriptional regulator